MLSQVRQEEYNSKKIRDVVFWPFDNWVFNTTY